MDEGINTVQDGSQGPPHDTNGQWDEFKFVSIPSSKEGQVGTHPQAQCFVHTSLLLPGPLNNPPAASNNYRIVSTVNKGLGMFATGNINMGDIILTERPLLVYPKYVPLNTLNCPDHDDPKTVDGVCTCHADYDVQLKNLINRLDPIHQRSIDELTNTHKKKGLGRIRGILATNEFDIGEFLCDKRGPAIGTYQALTIILSRVNHSCQANAFHYFDVSSFSYRLSAVRDITTDEEITITYCDVLWSASQRAAFLGPYGFRCDCHACLSPTTESDTLRTNLTRRLEVLQGLCDKPDNTDSQKKRVLLHMVKLVEAVEKDGLFVSQLYVYLLTLISQVSFQVNDAAVNWKYGGRLQKINRAFAT